jgi:four helix bundle protein
MSYKGKIERFEELIAWQKARSLTREIYRATSQVPFSQDYGLCRQIQRAAVSVMSNIAEDFERYSNREFAHYLSIAKGSLAEVRSQLYVALDLRYINQEKFDELQQLSIETKKLIVGLRNSTRESSN